MEDDAAPDEAAEYQRMLETMTTRELKLVLAEINATLGQPQLVGRRIVHRDPETGLLQRTEWFDANGELIANMMALRDKDQLVYEVWGDVLLNGQWIMVEKRLTRDKDGRIAAVEDFEIPPSPEPPPPPRPDETE
jgi:hypothetical protein